MFHSSQYAAALQALSQDSQADIFIAYGTRDDFTSVSKLDAWAADWSNAAREQGAAQIRVVRVENATHFWVGEARDELHRLFFAWLDDTA
jgi:alpha/beta superfamily hydrolase